MKTNNVFLGIALVLFSLLACPLRPLALSQTLNETKNLAISPEPPTNRLAESLTAEDDSLISVNFQNADINQVIAVLGDITGTVIIPPEDLTGTITISGVDRVQPEVVTPILESALMTKGYTIIHSDSTLKIVPLTDTKQTNVPVRVGADPSQISEDDVVITQVMPLQYASALQIKTMLQPLIGKYGNILSEDRTNTLIITDLAANIKRLATVIAEMDRSLPADTQVRTFVLNYGDAEKVAEILKSLSSDGTSKPFPRTSQVLADGTSVEIYGSVQAFAEKSTSSIVVSSAPVNFPALERIIRDLDTFPPQAMIEVVIMDVTLGDDLTMGVEYSDATTPTLTTKGIQKDLYGNNYKESIFHSLLGLATDASTAGFTYRVLDSDQTQQLLAYILKNEENTKVLSTPKILASNNQESSIIVGQEIPIIQSSTTDVVNNVTNVDYRYEKIGLNLRVTPRISRDNYVNLKVHAELKDLSAQTLYNASVINNREANATVLVPDGQTVVLGGLMRDNESIVEQKVPLLGDIPYLGYLFKKTVTTKLKTELVIFLTPHIVKDPKDLKRLSADAAKKMALLKAIKNDKDMKAAVQAVVNFEPKKSRLLPAKTKNLPTNSLPENQP